MKPTIVFEREAFEKITYWVDKSPIEISGFGLVEELPENILKVTKVFLLPQKNGPAHTDIEAEDVAAAMHKYFDEPGNVRMWWHSHVNMNVFWSGTDMDTIKKLGAGGWFAASVFNKKGEVKSAVVVADGMSSPWGKDFLFLDDVKTEHVTIVNEKIQEWEKEYVENCQERRYERPTYGRTDWFENSGYTFENGVWVKKPDTFPILNQSKDLLKMPSRPESMSKKQFKRWKKMYSVNKQEIQKKDYGFTENDKSLFAQRGWTEFDIEDFIENHDFTPQELVDLMLDLVEPSEIRYMLNAHYTPTDIMQLQFGDLAETKGSVQ